MRNTLAIWKPKGPTSHDIVDAVRRITGERRVGHAGTLDPMAEGILVIGIGREATRKLAEVVGQEKEYMAIVQFGATSTTDDAEGAITPTLSLRGANGDEAIPGSGVTAFPSVARDDIEKTLQQFIGHIEQVPPAYSAVKVRGKPAHRRARRGEVVTLQPRTVEIKAIELLEYTPPPTPPLQEGERPGATLKLRVVCGPGTYIRALARDIGAALGVGGYLTALTRMRVGTYTKDTALTIEQFRMQWPGDR
ncbi:MAG: tRNA pseudouridine(55) synthase TruB [bacterium]|nr:tRNA pseudouridine(55) synthase TruB [bacterium]